MKIAGLTSRDFKGISSLQEVECTGRSLKPEVKLLALQLYRLPENVPLASLNVISNSCVTLGEYSYCAINSADTHRSRLRLLVYDLDEGEGREYKCTANTLNSFGNSKIFSWKIPVRRRKSKWKCRGFSYPQVTDRLDD